MEETITEELSILSAKTTTVVAAPRLVVAANDDNNNNTNKKQDDKTNKDFRIYNVTTTLDRVINHYKDMRLNQTIKFYKQMEIKYTFHNGYYRKLMTIEQAFDELEYYVVSSISQVVYA